MQTKNEKGRDNFIQYDISNITKLIHDLRGEIHGIKIIGDFLHENIEILKKEDCKVMAQNMVHGCEKLDDFVNNMLNSSIINNDKYNIEKCDIVNICEEFIENTKYLFSNHSNSTLSFEKNTNSYEIYIDKFWFNQLLKNLVNNALKYSNGVNIKLKLDICNDEKEFYKIFVIDNGIGIPEEKLAKITKKGSSEYENNTNFNKEFNQNKNGTIGGLGLNICNDIVKSHNGIMYVMNNSQSSGTTICCKFPKNKKN